MVWSGVNSVNSVGNGRGRGSSNNFVNSIYNNNLNSVNEIQFLRGGGPGVARQQQQRGFQQQQAFLRDGGGQILPGADAREQQARMAQVESRDNYTLHTSYIPDLQ